VPSIAPPEIDQPFFNFNLRNPQHTQECTFLTSTKIYRTFLDSSSAGGFVFGKYKEELLFEIKDHQMDQMVPEDTTK